MEIILYFFIALISIILGGLVGMYAARINVKRYNKKNKKRKYHKDRKLHKDKKKRNNDDNVTKKRPFYLFRKKTESKNTANESPSLKVIHEKEKNNHVPLKERLPVSKSSTEFLCENNGEDFSEKVKKIRKSQDNKYAINRSDIINKKIHNNNKESEEGS